MGQQPLVGAPAQGQQGALSGLITFIFPLWRHARKIFEKIPFMRSDFCSIAWVECGNMNCLPPFESSRWNQITKHKLHLLVLWACLSHMRSRHPAELACGAVSWNFQFKGF